MSFIVLLHFGSGQNRILLLMVATEICLDPTTLEGFMHKQSMNQSVNNRA